MYLTRMIRLGVISVATLMAIGTARLISGALSQTPSAAPQTAKSAGPATKDESQKVVAGETEVKRLLLLMDADKNGKVSKAESMNFMAAEFDRLDTNHDGELDVKELQQSQLATAHRGGTHR